MSEEQGRSYDWDDEVVAPDEQGGDYTLLRPGEYPFRVNRCEYAQFPGGGKTPACKKVSLYLEVNGGDQGVATVKDDMILHSNFDWKIGMFFSAIGMWKKGEPLKMNWKAVPGRSGKLKIKHRKGTGKHADKDFNEVDRYITSGEAAEKPAPAPVQAPQPAPAGAGQDQDGFDWDSGQQQTGW